MGTGGGELGEARAEIGGMADVWEWFVDGEAEEGAVAELHDCSAQTLFLATTLREAQLLVARDAVHLKIRTQPSHIAFAISEEAAHYVVQEAGSLRCVDVPVWCSRSAEA